LIGKRLGMFIDRLQHSDTDGGPILISAAEILRERIDRRAKAEAEAGKVEGDTPVEQEREETES
jgi:hypothetical protein